MFNTNAITAKLRASSLLEIQEWASVLWVKAIVSGRKVCRFVSKKIGVYGYAASLEWEKDECDFSQEENEAQALGDIARFLPVGANPSNSNVELATFKVANGDMTIEEAVDFLSSKKPILRRR